MIVKDRGRTFEESGFPQGISMTLVRPEPWEWAAVQNAAVRRAAEMRQGSAAVEAYGFEAEEFECLKDPDTWAGITEYICAVELGIRAIKGWTGVQVEGDPAVAPVDRPVIARLFRIKEVREHFLAVMAREGERYLAAEGNA